MEAPVFDGRNDEGTCRPVVKAPAGLWRAKSDRLTAIAHSDLNF